MVDCDCALTMMIPYIFVYTFEIIYAHAYISIIFVLNRDIVHIQAITSTPISSTVPKPLFTSGLLPFALLS